MDVYALFVCRAPAIEKKTALRSSVRTIQCENRTSLPYIYLISLKTSLIPLDQSFFFWHNKDIKML